MCGHFNERILKLITQKICTALQTPYTYSNNFIVESYWPKFNGTIHIFTLSSFMFMFSWLWSVMYMMSTTTYYILMHRNVYSWLNYSLVSMYIGCVLLASVLCKSINLFIVHNGGAGVRSWYIYFVLVYGITVWL